MKLKFKPLVSVDIFHFNTDINLYPKVLGERYTFMPLDEFGTVTYVEKMMST